MLAFWLGVIGVIGFVWLLVVSRSFRITIAIIVGVDIALASIYAWLIKIDNDASIAKACLESRQEHSDFYAKNSTGIIADPTQFAGLVECSSTDQWRRLTEVERRDIAPNCGFENAYLIWPGKCFTEEQKGVRAYNACEEFIRNGGLRGQEADRMTIPDPTDKGESTITTKAVYGTMLRDSHSGCLGLISGRTIDRWQQRRPSSLPYCVWDLKPGFFLNFAMA